MKISKINWYQACMAVLSLLLLACGKGSSEAERFVKEIGDIRYELQVMPLETYKKSQDPSWKPEGNEADYLYVRLRLQHAKGDMELIKWNCTDQETYNKRLSFFNNEIRQWTYITAADATYYPLESIYENSYGISPRIDVVMVFRKPVTSETSGDDARFVFEDRVFTQQIIKISIKNAL